MWPELPLESWRETYDTLHMWMQIPGKICLALTPRTNHFWNIAFRVTPRGLTTPAIPCGDRIFTMAFDFVDHRLVIQVSDGARRDIALEPQTVAAFYRRVFAALHELGIEVSIWEMPVEFPNPIRFDLDETHRAYDPAAAETCWRILTVIAPVMESFRCRFIGKCSPVHFFWGSFDLAVTRFSGRRAPLKPDADVITRESYSHEVISHGWWPGGNGVDEPAFYAYAVPAPGGLDRAHVAPAAAYYHPQLNEFILPYDAVRLSATPEADLTAFMQTTYDAAADLAKWDRGALEQENVMPAACSHLAAIDTIKHAHKHECEECVKIKSRWVHLRTCQTCGVTLCCDSSPHKHASAHARATSHPVIASAEPGERWLYCYPDDAFVEY